jgi:REP element-mobilizing transposase RayT
MDYPDTFYHVLSRGNERRDIYYDERDYSRFLDCLEKMGGRFDLEVHAYVLMKNHYHLLIRTKEANLSRAIQWLGVSYSVWFNRRHKRSGHLFQGRFKSFLIEDDRYFMAMCHYIHGNPLRAGLVRRLWDYRWSSYRTYVDRRYQAQWLTTELVLGIYGGSRKEFLKAQEVSLRRDKSIVNELRYGLFLGGEEFGQLCIERVKK